MIKILTSQMHLLMNIAFNFYNEMKDMKVNSVMFCIYQTS